MNCEDFTTKQKIEYDLLIKYCEKENIPSPKIIEHDEGYDKDCFCQLCLSYGE